MTQPVSPDKPAGDALKACPVCTRPEHPRIYVTNAICSCTYCGWRAEIPQLGNTLTPPPSALDDEVVARLAKAIQNVRDEIGASESQKIAFAYAEAAMRSEFSRLQDSSK